MPIHSSLDAGGFDEAEARRQAIRRKLAQGGQAGGSVLERAGVDVPTTPFTPTVAERSQRAGEAQMGTQYRPSVLERNEQAQAGPFQAEDGEQRRARLFSQATRGFDVQAELARINAQQAQRIGETQAPSQQAQRDQRIGETVTPAPPPSTPWYEMVRRDVANLPNSIGRDVGQAVQDPFGTIGRTIEKLPPFLPIGPVKAIGGANNPFTRAIMDKISRLRGPARGIPGLADDAARIIGPEAAERAGRGFRGIGGFADEGAEVMTGWQRAAQARQAAAGARQAAGAMDDASLAAARQAQGTPLGQAILTRLGRLPTPVKIGGVGLGAGLAGVGVLQPQASPNDGANQIGQYEQKNAGPIGNPSGPTAQPPTAPTTQPPEGTPPAVGSVNPIYEGPPRVPYTPPSGPQGQPPIPPRGPVMPIDRSKPIAGPPMAGQPPIKDPRVSLPPFIDEGRRPPFGATPGQTPTGPTTGPLPEGPLNSDALRQQVVADLNGIAQIINAGPMAPDVMAIFASQGSKLLELIAEQEKTLRAQAESEGRTIDPATQNTLDVLREQLGLQLKQTRETLNSRGILDSGILIEAEQMLRKGNLSDQAKILSERLSRIQDNLNQGLGQFRQQRVQSASQFGMAGAQAQTQAELAERKRMDDLRQTLIQGRMGLGAQYAGEEQNALDRELAVTRMQAEIAARSGDREMEIAARAREEELNRQSAEAIARMNNATRQQGTFSPAQQAAGGFSSDATNEMLSTLRAHFASGGSLEDALASFQANSAYWASRGADISRVEAWLQQQGR